ncbi:peptidoglycan DD-metalloendopeptidase family protein [Halomonas koreensis]|uniref:Peptidoglycan DD-metalloendopeptidase family protein n=1 Tax=Halomonas koreensis TaxID=245385 RepID=A0ABU1FZA9_9GAMM|nr:peptidoglycan DD-metalloendopeptidase family protein [Halomonas koreensis]MDR5865572.1 peptidoglycan DD-metalloendopeptidase family protein [Halomonas koreensis]
MHKVLLISGLALTLAGCAATQEASQPIRVQDLSASRAADTPARYTVKGGDTLYGIAWRHDMDYRDLARLNDIAPPYRIQPGQQLTLGGDAGRAAAGAAGTADGGGVVATGLGSADTDDGSLDWLLPDGSTESRTAADEGAATNGDEAPGPVYDYDSPGADGELGERDLAERRQREAAEGDGEADDAAEPAATAQKTDAADDEPAGSRAAPEADAGTRVAGEPEAEADEPRRYTPVDEVPWQWPVDGEVIGAFGEGGSITAGIDIGGRKGQSVKAAGPGIVVYAGSGVRGYGNLILIKHNDQFLSAYAHNEALSVEENDVVEAGEVIATMGDSDAQDVRLHFEVRKDGQPQDPLTYLPER